jgi:hypothetical protein
MKTVTTGNHYCLTVHIINIDTFVEVGKFVNVHKDLIFDYIIFIKFLLLK